MFNTNERNSIVQRLGFLTKKQFSRKQTDYSIDYIKDNIVISVFSGKHEEMEDIIITQQNYYSYMNIKSNSIRRLFMTVFGVHRVYRLREMMPRKLRKKLVGLSQMECINVLADYLENNLDSLLNKPPRKILNKYNLQ